MKEALRLFFGGMALLSVCLSLAQAPLPPGHAHWTGTLDPADAHAGESARILMRVDLKPTWHVYKLKQSGGPTATAFKLDPNTSVETQGEPVAAEAKRIFDPNFGVTLGVYEVSAVFSLPVTVKAGVAGKQHITVSVTSGACNPRQCEIPRTDKITVDFTIAPGPARPDHLAALTSVPEQPAKPAGSAAGAEPASTTAVSGDPFTKKLDAAKNSGLLPFLYFSFVAGLLALLTPCVFPMIPITVSYFSKQKSEEGKTSLRGPLAYCLGIIGTFTALGLITTLIFGASGIQRLATNPFLNIALAVLFLVLAASLFGAFEFQLPSGLLTKLSNRSRGGGIVAPLLMGLTFTLTSFTCTVPFVGTLLVGASQGNILFPLLGMLAFSTAFALPFFLLALFPQYLAKLPKSGSWLSTVKAFMGFLEVAAALKFISNADLVFQTGLISKAVFLALWAMIGVLGGLYLLGWIRLGHEGELAKIGTMRRVFGVATIAAGVYCLAGIQGAPMGEFAAFLPPSEGKIPWVRDYQTALAQAKTEKRALLINFTGVTCTNCRWMEINMFPRPDVMREVGNFVPTELFTDRNNPGDLQNRKLLQDLTQSVTLPVYVVLSPEGKVLNVFPGSTRDEAEFVTFLKAGVSKSKNLAMR